MSLAVVSMCVEPVFGVIVQVSTLINILQVTDTDLHVQTHGESDVPVLDYLLQLQKTLIEL